MYNGFSCTYFHSLFFCTFPSKLFTTQNKCLSITSISLPISKILTDAHILVIILHLGSFLCLINYFGISSELIFMILYITMMINLVCNVITYQNFLTKCLLFIYLSLCKYVNRKIFMQKCVVILICLTTCYVNLLLVMLCQPYSL